MSRSYKTTASGTYNVKDVGSNSEFKDIGTNAQGFYIYKGFPCVYIDDVFKKSGNNSFYCNDVNSITYSESNIYHNYDAWNEVYEGSPFTYYDASPFDLWDEKDERYYSVDIGRAKPTFVFPGTRPSFSNVLYSNIYGIGINTISGGLTGTVNLVTITRTDYTLTIYAKRNWDNKEYIKTWYVTDFPDGAIPKRLLIELQGAGGGGGKGGTGVGGSTGNGGAGGGYWCGIIDVSSVHSWKIDMGVVGSAGTSSGGTGGDGGDTILNYLYESSSSPTKCVTVKGGKGANEASSTTRASGGGVSLHSANYYYTRTYATGGDGGTTRSGGTDAGGTNKLYVRCTTLSGSYDSPICQERGDKSGGSENEGNGGGASYFRAGASGIKWLGDGAYSGGDGSVGSGGGGSAYDFWDSPPAGTGGESGIVIWY